MSSTSGAGHPITDVYVLRHAESGNNARAEGDVRNADPGITELGGQGFFSDFDFHFVRTWTTRTGRSVEVSWEVAGESREDEERSF